jgi:hypothetical protein
MEDKTMIKANELRIGNLVYDNLGGILKIKAISLESGLSYIKPIPLTEEWLLKFGLDYTSEKDYYYLAFTIKDLLFETASSMDGFTYNLSCGNQINIKHVHQLQNIYFCLCGEELTIKEVTYER